MKKKIRIGILYLSLYNSLVKVFGVKQVIPLKTFYAKIGRQYLVPKQLRHLVVREMEKMKLIKVISPKEIEIAEYEINLHKEVKRFYREMGLLK